MAFAYIIDDNRDNADSLVQLLALLNYETRVALGPLPAMEALLRRKPDVIFLDVHMQGMDGIEVCRYIRREPKLAKVAIIAISSDTQSSLFARMQEAGADAFISKPISLEALQDALSQVAFRAAKAK